MTDAYGQFFERVMFPAWEGVVRRRPVPALWSLLEQTQWLERATLEAMQGRALRRLIDHAITNVPYYREALGKAGVRAGDVRGLADLARLPVLTRELARSADDARRSLGPERAVIEKASSGTSGDPLSFAYDEGSEHWRQAVKLRGYAWAGHRPGTRTFHYWGVLPPRQAPTIARRGKVAVERLLRRDVYVDCARRGEAELDRALDALRRCEPQAMICYAFAGGDLARQALARGVRLPGEMSVICSGEPLFPDDREAIARAFGPRVFDTYGCREVMLVAAECERHDGLHVSMENVVCEVAVRERDGYRPARPGEVGEVLVTDLHNFGMPFVRYANGDLAVAGPDEPCACGRGLARLAAVEGRVTETLRDADGARVGGMVFITTLATVGDRVRSWQGVQHGDGSITLRFVPGEGFDDSVAAHLERSLLPYFGGLPVRVQRVASLPVEPSGKRRPVVVERPRGASVSTG